MQEPHLKTIGRFQLTRPLGEGAQGAVFLALDPYLQRQVAIKVLRAQSAGAKGRQARLLQEARTVSKLQHPNIVPIFEAGEHAGTLYLVFEYVEGVSLLKLIENKDSLTVPGAVELMCQILDGVGYAHGHDIIHRDLKPANILVAKNGVPRVMDFGLSHVIGEEEESDGELKGTLQYMSPEHFSDTPIRPCSDVFALGLMLYEMLTLAPAITGENHFNIIYKIINEPTVAPSVLNPQIDPELDRIVLKAVQKDQKDRFPDANAMRKELADYVARRKSGAGPVAENFSTHSTIDFLLRRMQHKTDFPAFSECVLEVNRITSSGSQATAKELAAVILKDYALTNKLLKLINSSFYGQFGGNITSIYKTVVMLGFERVRLAASSVMLFNHLQGQSATLELKDAMIKSFMSGMIARDLCRRSQWRKTEVAFLCAMFHDLGRNLTIYYFPEEYAEMENLMSSNGHDIQSAARSVLGVSLDELGVGVARAWKFPETILYCMRGLPNGTVENPHSIFDRLRHFSVFANELCDLAGSGLQENHEEPLSRLVHRFEHSFCLSETDSMALLQSTISNVRKYAEIMNVEPERSPFIQNLVRFIGPEDPCAGVNGREDHFTQTAEFGEIENSTIETPAQIANPPGRKAEDGPPFNASPASRSFKTGAWFRKLVQRLGLKRVELG